LQRVPVPDLYVATRHVRSGNIDRQKLNVTGADAGTAAGIVSKTYTVKAGTTLSKSAKQHPGDANASVKILEANRNPLSHRDLIGQS